MDCKDFVLSEDVRDILVDYAFKTGEIRLAEDAYCYQPLEEGLGILSIPAYYEAPFLESGYRYLYTPKCYAPMQLEVDTSYEVSGIYEAARKPLGLTGKQVLIGLIDTGIRSSLPVFQTPDGSTRIFALWDQTDQSGIAPSGFFYGSEYRREDGRLVKQLDGKASNEGNEQNAKSGGYAGDVTDPGGHGTAVASCALAAAKDAELVMVKLRGAKRYLKEYYAISQEKEAYAETDILAGLAYLEKICRETGRPLVICFTMGTNMGDHASGSLLDDYLFRLGNRREHGIVIAGGNEGNKAHHYEGAIRTNEREGYEDVEIRVAEGVNGFSCELWGSLPAVYTVMLRSPDGELLQRLVPKLGNAQSYSFVYSDTKVTVSFLRVERNSDAQLIRLRFERPLAGIWTVRVFAGESLGAANFHIWLPVESFLDQPVYFLKPDPLTTLTVPAYLENALSVSYYDAANGSFAIDSGRGFDRRGQAAPALCAPGVLVETALGKRSGASLGAALAAGAAAQLMEWAIVRGQDALLNSRGLRNYFIRGAVREENLEFPNPTWGYGRLTISGIFEKLKG